MADQSSGHQLDAKRQRASDFFQAHQAGKSAERHAIRIDKAYVWMLDGNWYYAAVLAQIAYWFDTVTTGPRKGKQRVMHHREDVNGVMRAWLVETYEGLAEQCEMKYSTVRKAVRRLRKLGLIYTESHFSPFHHSDDGAPVKAMFIRLDEAAVGQKLLEYYALKRTEAEGVDGESSCAEMSLRDRSEMSLEDRTEMSSEDTTKAVTTASTPNNYLNALAPKGAETEAITDRKAEGQDLGSSATNRPSTQRQSEERQKDEEASARRWMAKRRDKNSVTLTEEHIQVYCALTGESDAERLLASSHKAVWVLVNMATFDEFKQGIQRAKQREELPDEQTESSFWPRHKDIASQIVESAGYPLNAQEVNMAYSAYAKEQYAERRES